MIESTLAAERHFIVENKGVFGVVWIETNLNYDHVILREMPHDFELCMYHFLMKKNRGDKTIHMFDYFK